MLDFILAIVGILALVGLAPMSFLKSRSSSRFENYFYKTSSIAFLVLGILLASSSILLLLFGLSACLMVFIFFVFGNNYSPSSDQILGDSERLELFKIEEEVKRANSKFLD